MNKIIQGDVLKVLKTLPDGLIDCVVTSPPYWGLRDYGIDGQFGLEPTLDEYIDKMTAVFREVRRVLKPEGTLWLNMGDGYNGSGPQTNKGFNERWGHGAGDKKQEKRTGKTKIIDGLKPKDLIGQPWRLAFALQADGWYLRSDIIWAKPNPMPESVTDRPTKAHEYIFLMSKQPKYFYDADAVREPGSDNSHGSPNINPGKKQEILGQNQTGTLGKWSKDDSMNGRNKRTVWTVATQPFPEAHFATFPEKLIEPCIRAGTSEKGYCSECGKPWVRVVESRNNGTRQPGARRALAMGHTDHGPTAVNRAGEASIKITIGWQPSCDCDADTTPGLVLDPFMGSGTTALVSLKLNRRYLGIELNQEYIDIANKRINKMALFK